jgi:two-component system NtrC family sensor kinase
MAIRRIAIRLTLSFLLIIVIVSAIFSVVGIRFIGNRVVAEAKSKVEMDLNVAREIYDAKLGDIYDVVRFTADRFYLRNAVLTGDFEMASGELSKTFARERLDVLTVTDRNGIVLLRATNPYSVGDSRAEDVFVTAALQGKQPVSATTIVPADILQRECPDVAERAHSDLVETPGARPTDQVRETSGMMLKAAAPIFDSEGQVIGVIYGGLLLNRRYDVVDRMKETVFRGAVYEGRDLGAATIFQNDLRISTNYVDEEGQLGIGTRVTEDIYERVIAQGQRWIGSSFVVDTRYLAAYEPIRNINGEAIGMLGIGILEEPYLDLKRRTSLLFLAITLGGALLAICLSYLIARRLAVPVRRLVAASREVAHGNLDAKVEISPERELSEVAQAFNYMASALKARDEKLKEFTKKKIMESERLAVIGQLAADVAHEINNPLQGIVTYSHLLLEKTPAADSRSKSLEKIAKQANRCRTIIRGLLDFSRPRKPHKKASNMNSVLDECIALVENQAIFLNIEIQKHCNGGLPEIVVDPSQMQQVFLNMIFNAAEAMEGAGQLTITTRYDPVDQVIEVEFADTGQGISDANIERIFDPFFTTKEVGHGTGLGLAISYGIIREHQGNISVESEVGKGTTFVVHLPVTAKEEALVSG